MSDTLYDTIGGSRRINSAVELFYSRVFADESLRPFFEGVDLKGLSARQSMFVSMLVGGQKVYTGKNLALASRNIGNVTLTTGDLLNTYDILRPGKLLFTRSAFETVEARLNKE